jgi:hypothetical protein
VANPTNALAANYNNRGDDTRNAFATYGAAGGKFVNSATSTYGSNDSGYGTEDLGDDENKRRGRKLYEDDYK